jgi:two-component system sensor histidine kinase/response regulator
LCLVLTSVAETNPAILIVDDHRANLLALEVVLRPLGYRVVSANSGAEALRRLIEDDFVLIVMDVHMPDLDGYQTVTLIRQHPQSRDVPVMFLTAVYDQPEQTYRGYALGAVDYISKPFDPEILRGKVSALVRLFTRGERAARERAQQAERMKDLFLGAVGHDLRSPLGAILLGAQMTLRSAECTSPEHATFAKKIERAANRMQGIIEDILDMTRGQFAGGIALSPRPTNGAEVCRNVVEECRLTHASRSVQVDFTGDLNGHWDPDRLGRVVANLVGNAMEYGGDGPVSVRLGDEGDGIRLDVHNDGAPIDPAKLPILFEPFRRGREAGDGLGLGLYIVREIVHAHGGAVAVTSTVEQGTTFTVTLPKRLSPELAG